MRNVIQGQNYTFADLAYPLPASVILDMLGLPCDDLDRIKVWSDELALFVGSSVNTPDKYQRATDSITAMNEYFSQAIERRREKPSDDLLSALLIAQDQEDLLSPPELLATCVLLVFAGHETTTNLIGNGMLALLRHPEQLERLRNQPELLPSAIEELLRFDGPAASVVRVATEDHILHNQSIRAGDRVFAMLSAANRDPRQFSLPETLDIARKENRHIAFGHGIHYCVGAPLARLEAKIAIQAILHRCNHIQLQTTDLQWSSSLVLRGVKSLPVSFGTSTS